MKKSRLLLLLLLVLFVSLFFLLDLEQYFNLNYLKQQQHVISEYYHNHPLETVLFYSIIYVTVTGLSLPGAAIMTLAGGALFGLLWGTVIVSFASTTGASLAFLLSRYIFRDPVQEHFGSKLAVINRGIENEGAFYLFTLRLVPLFPFFVINILMGLTPMRLGIYFIVSQVGMLPGTLVYINAGTQLAQVEAAADILSAKLLVSFALLGLFPLLAKKIVDLLRKRAPNQDETGV